MHIDNTSVAYGATVHSAADSVDDTNRLQTLIRAFAEAVELDDVVALKALTDTADQVEDIVAGLLQSDYSPLHRAAACNKEQCLRVMFDRLPFRVWHFRTTETQSTPLMLAAKNGHAPFIHELNRQFNMRAFGMDMTYQSGITAKADFGCEQASGPASLCVWRSIVDASDVDGNTPLLLAVKNHHAHCVRKLLDVGASPSATNHQGDGMLRLARQQPSDAATTKGPVSRPDGTPLNIEYVAEQVPEERSARRGCALM
jgi:hypothetical protein